MNSNLNYKNQFRIRSIVILLTIFNMSMIGCTLTKPQTLNQTEEPNSPQENTPNQELVRFEQKRTRPSIDPSKPPSIDNGNFHESDGVASSYSPFNTDCSPSEIEEYISKSITGGAEATPFVNEFSVLLACGSEAAPYLIKVLSTGDEQSRFNATIALGDMGAVANEAVVPALIAVIRKDPNPSVRVQAIEAIKLISPPTDEVLSVLSEARSDKEIIAGSGGPRGEPYTVSEFAGDYSSNPEYRDPRCPIKHVWGESVRADYIQSYRFDRNSGQCVAEGNDRPPATGGSSLIKSFCEFFRCRKKN